MKQTAAENAESVASVQAELAQAQEQQQDAQASLAQLQQEHDCSTSRVAELEATVQELQASLHTVTCEKTEVLVQLADAKQLLRDGGSQNVCNEDESWGAWPWRTDGFKAATQQKLRAGRETQHKR